MSAAQLARRNGRAARALRTALGSIALDRIGAAERVEIERIDTARPMLASGVVEAASDNVDRSEAEHLAEANEAVKWMSIPPVLGRLLYRAVRELKPRACLELGTGFGLSTAYQAAALKTNGSGQLTSLDIEEMVTLARPALAQLGLEQRIELVGGAIEQTLTASLANIGPIDFAFLDADHTEAGTLAAFDAISPRLSPGAVVVFDDINWTKGMRRAWPQIKARRRIADTISLRRFGIVIISDTAR